MQGALHNARLGMRAVQASGVLASTTALALLFQTAQLPHWQGEVAACAAIAGLSAGAWRLLLGLERRLTYTGYCHAER